jgi:hypothetical protein
MGHVEQVEVVEYADVMCSWAGGLNRSCGCSAGATAEKLALFSGTTRRAYRLD